MSGAPAAAGWSQHPLAGFLRARLALPLVTRVLFCLCLLAMAPTMLPFTRINDVLADAAAVCPRDMQTAANPIGQLYRFVVSPLVHTDFVSGALACIGIATVGQRLEQQRGSIALAQIVIVATMMTHAIHMVLVPCMLASTSAMSVARAIHMRLDATRWSSHSAIPIWGAQADENIGASMHSWEHVTSLNIPTQACSLNNWAILFTLIVIECTRNTRDTKRFIFLIPFPLPTRLVPLVCLALFQFWCGIQLHTLIGFAVGYLFCFIPALTFTTPMLRLCEVHALRRRSSFVCVDRAGLAQPWEHFVQDATEREFGVANSPQTLTSSPGNLSRSAFPVNRAARTPSADAHWPHSDDSSPLSSNSADVDDQEDGDGTTNRHSPHRRDSAEHDDTFDPSEFDSVPGTRDAVFAANVARILEPAYPTQTAPQ